MKKFGLFALALSLSVSVMSAPKLANYNAANAAYQQAQPTPPLPDDARPFYEDYYNEKDEAKKYEKAKIFLEKFPNIDPYWRKSPLAYIARYELKQVYNKCSEADKTFFATPNEANLNGFLSACDAWISKSPKPDAYFSTRMPLGTGYGVLVGFYKDTARGMQYTEKALPMLAQATAPEGWKQPEWDSFRKDNTARLIQYQGLYYLRQTPPDNEKAIEYLTKAANIKEGTAYKDPNTYLLRAEATTSLYTKLNAEYNTLSNDEKTGEKGKGLLGKIYPVVEKMTNDYARVMALTEGKPEYKAVYDDAKGQCEAFAKFLNKDFKIEELVKHFKPDVSVADMKIKTEESTTTPPPTAPKGGKGGKTTATAPAGGTAKPDAGGSEKPATPAKATTKAPVKKPR